MSEEEVEAECHSDDHVVEAKFNAIPYLTQAAPEQLNALQNCGWGFDYPADEVAEWSRDRFESVAKMFDYLEMINRYQGYQDSIGFECSIDGQQATAWLLTHRPEVNY